MPLIRTIPVGVIDATPLGLTTDKKYLYWFGSDNDNIYQMDKRGNLIRTIPIGAVDNLPGGLTFDGNYLWFTGGQNSNIYQWAR